jgi:hypothetical protein
MEAGSAITCLPDSGKHGTQTMSCLLLGTCHPAVNGCFIHSGKPLLMELRRQFVNEKQCPTQDEQHQQRVGLNEPPPLFDVIELA